ncbi:MAG: 23S rRNA (pseudouridine(1915)-N(3))-methyltransferase RlmH [Parachlamydiaceae bacterium]
MYKIRIFSVGKTKEKWLDEAIAEYLKRLQQTATIEFVLLKNDDLLTSAVQKESDNGTVVLCLDATGKTLDSEGLSNYLLRQLELGGARLVLVIGGAEGLPPILKNSYPLLSLSALTFTHQVIRLILVEQIYRAFEIAKGSKYHK